MAVGPFRKKKQRDDAAPADGAAFVNEVEVARHVQARYPAHTPLSFGAPTRCPHCGDFGLVEQLDPRLGTSQNRCVSCGAGWGLTARAVRFVNENPAHLAAPEPAPATVSRAAAGEAPGVLFAKLRDQAEAEKVAAADRSRGAVTMPGPSTRPILMIGDRPLNPLRVLLVEDDEHDLELVRAILEPAGPEIIDLRTARTRAAGEEESRATRPEVVMLDLTLPDSHGLATVTRWHFNAGAAPLMVMSGEPVPDVVDRGAELGVADYLDKSQLDDILARGELGTNELLGRLAAAAAS
jgi:CheY-like chemotaxis protein